MPARVPIPKGTQVQSLPGPGELPQTFETVEDLDGLTSWNTLTIRTNGHTINTTGVFHQGEEDHNCSGSCTEKTYTFNYP